MEKIEFELVAETQQSNKNIEKVNKSIVDLNKNLDVTAKDAKDGMTAIDVHMATGAHRHASARPFNRELCALAQFHHIHPHIRRGIQLVHVSFSVRDAHANHIIFHGLAFKSVHPVHRGVLQN